MIFDLLGVCFNSDDNFLKNLKIDAIFYFRKKKGFPKKITKIDKNQNFKNLVILS